MKRLYNNLILCLPFLIVFIFSLFGPSDPDLGWHLKYGEYFFQHGTILRENVFSTMMAGYQWANTSWFTDLISYTVFHFGGFLGLSLLSAFIVTLTFWFVAKIADLTLWEKAFLFPLLLYLQQPVNAISWRGQQLSLLAIVIMFYLFKKYKEKPKYLYLLLPLFFVWANINGEFFFGIGLFAIWICFTLIQKYVEYLYEEKIPKPKKKILLGFLQYKNFLGFLKLKAKECLFLFGIFFLSLGASCLNPFGIGVHSAAISHAGSHLLKYVAEYLPFEMLSQGWWNQIIIAILLVLGFLNLFFKNKLVGQLPLLVTVIIVFLLSMEVRRYAWPAYYLIIPLLKPLANYFRPDSKKVTHYMTVLFLFILLGLAIGSKYPYSQLVTYNWDTYCLNQSVSCSPQSAKFLIEKNLTNDLFTLYAWGGWLIWNYPEIKPVIDGRMHLWEQNGYSAFEDYYWYEQDAKDFDKSHYNVAYLPLDKPLYNQMIKLVNQGKWKQVYEDPYAAIFVRNN